MESRLRAIVTSAGASWLPDWMRDHEWEDRFNPMKAKRLGPSIVPAEVIVPLSSLSTFFNRVDAFIRPPVVVEATVVKGEEVILLCLIPHDRRKLTFNLAFILSLSVLRLAKRLGGRAYASGLFLGQEARAVHGMRLKMWQDHKRNKDHRDLFNPGKLSGIWLMKIVITLALWFEPMARIAGNMVRPRLAEVWNDRERAALAWAESVTYLIDGDVPDPIYQQACEQFSAGEIDDLSFAIAEINAWNRLMVCSRTPPHLAK